MSWKRTGRRRFLKTAGAALVGAGVSPCLPDIAFGASRRQAALPARTPRIVEPFRLADVTLTESVFTQKRDRLLHYAKTYGSETDIFAGPDRMLSNFRATAGLDTRNAQPPGSWDNATGYLRGHYSGHFMSLLAQSYAGTGDDIYKRKLDYMVRALGECQDALAAAAQQPTPRAPGRFGSAVRLTGTPVGMAEHVALPAGIVSGLSEFTIAMWINPALYDRAQLSDPNPSTDPAVHNNMAAIFDFGSPNAEYAAAPQSRMFMTVRVSNNAPVPRFAITTNGANGEQRIDGASPLPVGQWTHLAVTRSGNTGTLFVNGRPTATNANLTLRPSDLGKTASNWIGRNQFPQLNVSYLNAAIDEFQIFDYALSAVQVESLLESAGGNIGGGNVAWYRFDEPHGRAAMDSSGKGRHAAIIAPTDGRRHPGFLSAYPETPFIRLEEFATYGGNQGIWAPYYTLHKIMAGLLDAYTWTGNAQALDIVSKIGDWVYSRLAPLRQEQLNRMWNTYIAGEYGGCNESLAQLHALRPEKQEYLAAARRFDNTIVYSATVRNEDILDGRHANQHIPQFTGYLRVFEEGGEAGYMTAARNFWDMIVPHRIYSHGGMGVGEILRKRDVIAGSLYQTPNDNNHAETCAVYNMLKLSRNLFFHDPEAKYMNYYEQALTNQILGSRRDIDSAANPQVTYFVPVRSGQRRSYGNAGTCCGGTGLENHTKYQDSIYFRSADSTTLYISLYIGSKLEWRDKGFTIEQVTRYPMEGASRITVRGAGPLDIKLRVPMWARKGYQARINGAVQNLQAVPGAYITLSRRWTSGDTIDISMPFSFRAERALDNPAIQSVFYGPTLMAVEGGPTGSNLNTGLLPFTFYKHVKLDGDLAPAMSADARPLHFTTNGQTLFPFFVADPNPTTTPYHVYVQRVEPAIVFGSIDSGVPNKTLADGLTFLDVVWDEAPFADHEQFVGAVGRISSEWVTRGLLNAAERAAIMEAAGRARSDLRV